MLTLAEIFTILIVHWIADFVLQTDRQAKGKSKNWDDLLGHTFGYSVAWSIPMCYFLLTPITGVIFVIITFITHTITDYFTSRLNSKLVPERWNIVLNNGEGNKTFWHYPKGENWHNFFVSVGFDQILHYVQLFTTYYLLKQL
jgi:hypothetical protein